MILAVNQRLLVQLVPPMSLPIGSGSCSTLLVQFQCVFVVRVQ